jgi:hypothetical protein
LERPADEWEHRVGWGFRGHMRIGVQAMQHTQTRKLEVPEDVLGDERWTE